MNYAIAFCFLIFAKCAWSKVQTIVGSLSQLANQEIRLEGFRGLKSYPIANAKIDASGNFKLNYDTADYGVGYLISNDEKPMFVILSGENIEIKGETLAKIETVKVIMGQENLFFEQYAKEHPKREQALNAWLYLDKMYHSDPLFAVHKKSVESIEAEKLRIKTEESTFLANLPKTSYVNWFLPTRKLVSSVSTVAQYRPDEIQATLSAFRYLDYTDNRLYKSGLFKDAIDNHFWLCENSGKSLDSVFIEMKKSIDAMMTHLVKDQEKLNEITNYLFDLLERHSLFQASEYLALKVLNETSCTIDSELAKQLESYRAMKKGTIAPEIDFGNYGYVNGIKQGMFPNLSSFKTPYALVIFGASWCPKCM
jgi:hypothetical protein